MKKKVVIAMSGGVDSSVAAWLLKEAGFEVIGISLKLAPDQDNKMPGREGRCCSVDDLTDARQVCDALDIPFYAIDARQNFKSKVFDPFVRAYANGLTPNPCLLCNQYVKFGDLFQTAKSLGARLATGHYSVLTKYKGVTTLKRPKDTNKDQSYYLYNTPPEVLEVLELPLGEMLKSDVRKLAAKIGLKVSDKPDSQEICFVPSSGHATVVENALGEMPKGDLIHIDGRKIAEHKGIHHFTIGQRRGIGVGIGKRAYVVDINAKTNEVTIGPKEALECEYLEAKNLSQMVPIDLWPKEVWVQIRARAKAKRATWKLLENGNLAILFTNSANSIAIGQAAVLYDNDTTLLGGGTIDAKGNSRF